MDDPMGVQAERNGIRECSICGHVAYGDATHCVLCGVDLAIADRRIAALEAENERLRGEIEYHKSLQPHIYRAACSNCGKDRTDKGSLIMGEMVFCDDDCFERWDLLRRVES